MPSQAPASRPAPPPKKPSLASIILSFVTDLLIDGLLIGLGAVLYYQFFVDEIFPVTISPVLTGPVGGVSNAAYIICGVPFVIGILSLVRSISRTYHQLAER